MRMILLAAAFAALGVAQQPKASLEGKVVDASGQPIIRVTVSLLPDGVATPLAGRPAAGPTAQSDKDGKFALTSLDPGRYRVFGEKNGLLKQAYGARPGSTEGTVLNLTAGQSVKDISIEMIPMGSISGRILDDHGDPLRAIVELYRKGYTQGRQGFARVFARSNELDGSFGIFDLPPGQYYVHVTPPNVAAEPGASTPGTPIKDGHLGTFYGGATDAAQATPIQVSAGVALTGMDIRVARGPYVRVSGRVTGPNPPQRLIMLPKDLLMAGLGSITTVAADGTFGFPGTAPGEYRLAASTGPGQGVVESYGWMDLNVGSREVEGITLQVQPRFDVRGRVIVVGDSAAGDDPPSLPSSLGVRLVSELSTAGANGPVGADGSFTVPRVAHVKYQANLSTIPTGMYLAEMRMGQQDVLSTGLDFTAGGPGDTLRITLKRTPGELAGLVQTEEGKARAGAIVTLIPEPARLNQPYLYRRVTTDQNGQFDIKDVTPGEYTAYGWEDLETGAEMDSEFLKQYRGKSAKVSIEDSARKAISLMVIRKADLR